MGKQAAPLISIVIITKNQRAFLTQSLPVLKSQQIIGVLEIIVVDSGSTDGAREFVQNISGVCLTEMPANSFNYARAHNQGAQMAKGDILVRLSGDAIPQGPDWLARLTEPFDNPAVAASWGRQVTPANVHNPLEKWAENQLRPTVWSEPRIYRHDVTVLGCNMAYRRDLWCEHPFDERMSQAEDYAWMHHWYRRGYTGVYVPQAAVLHGHNETLPRALRRSLAQSVLQGLVLAGVY